MVLTYNNKILRVCWSTLLAFLLVACYLVPAYASVESNLLGRELKRQSRTVLTPKQRRAAGILNRYQRQKSRENRRHKPAAAAPQQGAQQAQSQDYGDTGNQPVYYSATHIDCTKMLAEGAEKKYLRTTIARVQQELISLGFSPGKLDGKLGPDTRAALKEFCKIDRAYPHWPRLMGSVDFDRWSGNQPDQQEIDQALLSGNAAKVMAVLDRYMKDQAFTPVTWADDALISYVLSEEDFNQLKSQKEIFSKIAELQGKSFLSRQDFETALEAALKGVADPQRYIQLVERYVEPRTAISLTEQSFARLRKGNTPAYILQSLQDLQGVEYTEDKVGIAVDEATDALIARTMGFEEEIVKLVEISPSGARFTDNSLKKFSEAHEPGDLLAAIVLTRLQKMKEVVYQSNKTVAAAVKNVLGQLVEQIDASRTVIVDAAEEAPAYSLDNNSLQEISKQLEQFVVPEIYLEMLADMHDVEYPSAELFWQALQSRIHNTGSNNTFRNMLFGVIGRLNADEIDDSIMEKLKEREVAPAVLAYIGKLKGRKFEDEHALKKKLDELFEQLSKDFEKYHAIVVAQATKKHPFDPSKKIQWSGESCDCVHRNLAGDIYGFYPYWMAGGKQVIDFSLLTRVGYYGLGFNDKGEIAFDSRWSGLDTEFIREAQTYGTKVDLVIYRNDWKTWNLATPEEKTEAFNTLAEQIADLVGIPLSNLFSKATPYLSLGLGKQPIMGDGVTLYFDGYPQDQESVQSFTDFIHTLSLKLAGYKRKLSINIMFPSTEMGQGIHDYSKLMEQIGIIRDNKLQVLFPVLMHEPSTYNKKQLRLKVENGLHGENRMKLLRHITMVITYDGHDPAQLTDDVIYAKDNFSGIGFWPQPLVQETEAGPLPGMAGEVTGILRANYLNTEAKDAPYVCQYVCPHKWTYRIVWGIFFFIMLGTVLLRFISCSWRSFFDKHFIHFIIAIVLPTTLLSLALLFCDPGWQVVSRDKGGLIILIMLAIGYVIWNYKDKKRKARLP